MQWAAGVAILGGAVLLVVEHGLSGLVGAVALGAVLLAALPRGK